MNLNHPTPRFAVNADAFRGSYNPKPPGHPPMCEEYRFVLRVRNTGPQPVKFDEIELVYQKPVQGCLTTTMTPAGKGHSSLLEPGSTFANRVATNGYTPELLAGLGSSPLEVYVWLNCGGKQISESYMAVLPPLASLPETPPAAAGSSDMWQTSAGDVELAGGKRISFGVAGAS